ncbi:hypothetical protein IEO70_10745 [Bacillus sp. AGMB 02131]|uniref:Uncharacterized protein n=1 Tax=Peribacillus faecalis TaxID=2772559 RepID=A0A927CW15_9BACI|nr:hypothetical protein [Peribacillus faecalis]MBD3108842.1 hypothetical protein [Peribacillus faecalis]
MNTYIHTVDGVKHYVFENKEKTTYVNGATTLVTYPKLDEEILKEEPKQTTEDSSNSQTTNLKKEEWEQKLDDV